MQASSKPEFTSIHHLVEEQVAKTPDAIAVHYQGNELTYKSTNEAASGVAKQLLSIGIMPGDRVGLCIERSFDLIVGLLGILKAGAAYLPLDVTYPAERLRFMMEDSEVKAVVTQRHLASLLPKNFLSLYLDEEARVDPLATTETNRISVTAESIAYIIYTSGSTGQPKGVAMPQEPLVNLLKWQTDQFFTPAARTVQFTPISFDVSFQEIFLTLTTGGTLFLIEEKTRKDAESLLRFLSTYKIERLFLPFVALQNLAEVGVVNPDLPLVLKEVVTAGEQLKVTRSVAKWFSILNNCLLCNQYGPSESHVVSSYTLTGEPQTWPHLPPIGKPITNAKFYLLDQSRRRKDDAVQLAADGEPGELAIGGAVLAQGYLNRPELNSMRFVSDPFSADPNARLYRTGDLVQKLSDGNYKFIERIDNQVKIRGFRVELGEVEAALGQHEAVSAVTVTARQDETERKQLVAYIVLTKVEHLADTNDIEVELREWLNQRLPSHMVPAFFVFMAAFPLTPSGKVDRRALPSPANGRPALKTAFIAPRSEIESQLAEIWSKTLNVNPVGVNDNFFDIGGDSLRAIQLIHQIKSEFDIDLPIVSLFDTQTISKFAKLLKDTLDRKHTSTSDNISVADLEREAELELGITVSELPVIFPSCPQSVLVTGVTGFLGVFLLRELLEQTQATAHCLVRTENVSSGFQKVEDNLRRYGLWKNEYRDRIAPIIGDLGKPQLGLPSSIWQRLAQEIEVIYHSGASISLINPYSTMRAANVLGTQALLKLATEMQMKPFHFISTLDVFQTSQAFSSQFISEQDSLKAIDAVHFDGYTKSKWVSEQMVWNAGKQGLPVTVYRPAMISGDSKTGIANTGDLMNRLIRGFIQLGCAPESNMVVNIAPVDFFSKGVIYLSQQPEFIGKAFNFINPNPVSIKHFVEAISFCGYPVQLVDHNTWEKTLTKNIGRIDGIVSVLTSKRSAEQHSYIERSSVNAWQVSCRNVIDGLANTSICCPVIDSGFLAPYLTYFESIGFIEPASNISRF